LTRGPANVAEVRATARRRIPRPVFDFIEGGAEEEVTRRANLLAFRDYEFQPRALVDVSERSAATTVLGTSVSMPVLLAPCGLARLANTEGESATARAAADAGTVFTLSAMSSRSLEEVAAAGSGPQWFQLYVWRDREVTETLVERARTSGYTALCFTIDVPVTGRRERDVRNGMTIPPRPAPRTLFSYASHPGWVRGALLGEPITFRNFIGQGSGDSAVALGSFVNSQLNPSMNWDDLVWLREIWSGPIVVKGIMRGEDAKRSIDLGADGVVVSNHGGRQLDGLPSTLSVLPEVVEAVGSSAEVYIDGGIRRGTDVVKALALGARACMVGRPWMYGLAAGGEQGVRTVLDLFQREIDVSMALLGVRSVSELEPDLLRQRS
jgi:L-lactate dehydrogenase (cytochrome)